MSSDRPPIRPDGFPERPTPLKRVVPTPAKEPTRSFKRPPPSGPPRTDSKERKIWILWTALGLSIIGNVWQAGEISGLKAHPPSGTETTGHPSEDVDPQSLAAAEPHDTGDESRDTGQSDSGAPAKSSSKSKRGVWAVDTASGSDKTSESTSGSKLRVPPSNISAVRLYLKQVDLAKVDTSDAPLTAEITGEIFELATSGHYDGLDMHIVALLSRIALFEEVIPPESCLEFHRLSILELSQGVKLLETLQRSQDGQDPKALELADTQAAQLNQTHTQVAQMSKEIEAGQGRRSRP